MRCCCRACCDPSSDVGSVVCDESMESNDLNGNFCCRTPARSGSCGRSSVTWKESCCGSSATCKGAVVKEAVVWCVLRVGGNLLFSVSLLCSSSLLWLLW